MKRTLFIACLLVNLLQACSNNGQQHGRGTEKIPRAETASIQRTVFTGSIHYHPAKTKEWRKTYAGDSTALHIVCTINRMDSVHLFKADSIIVPDDYTAGIVYYLPFPLKADALNEVDKLVIFSYPVQSFGVYEKGTLVYAGATNMGRKKDPTPNGLFFTNWKAEETTSTFNDEWELRWNFNIENKLGIGWHQYAMPGYPASHSCMRLLEEDARWLYQWADQWQLNKKDSIIQKGTPVIVYGNYKYGSGAPWKKLLTDPHANDITTSMLEEIIKPYSDSILLNQGNKKKRP